jgi:hypothetical protein
MNLQNHKTLSAGNGLKNFAGPTGINGGFCAFPFSIPMKPTLVLLFSHKKIIYHEQLSF